MQHQRPEPGRLKAKGQVLSNAKPWSNNATRRLHCPGHLLSSLIFFFFEEGGRRWKLDSQLASTTGNDLFLVVLNSNLNTMAITFKDKLSPCLRVTVDSQPCGQTDYKARRHVTGYTLLQEHLSLCYDLFKGSSTFEISLSETKYSTSVFPYHMGCQTTAQDSSG